MPKNPFADDPIDAARPANPFGEDTAAAPASDADPAETIAYSAARIRRLKSLVGAEGLTLSATRELLDHVSAALDAVARSLRDLGQPGGEESMGQERSGAEPGGR